MTARIRITKNLIRLGFRGFNEAAPVTARILELPRESVFAGTTLQ